MEAYAQTEADQGQIKAGRRWMWLGVAALGISGLFSPVPVSARMPVLSDIVAIKQYFQSALVVHVDLSVLAWLLAMACMFWSLGAKPRWGVVSAAAQTSFALGMAAMAGAAFLPGERIMSNYIPVLLNPLFMLGLALIFCAVLLALSVAFAGLCDKEGHPAANLGMLGSALIAAAAAGAFLLSYRMLPAGLEPDVYYEYLFWGGGHLLQFLHVQLMMVAWLMLMGSLVPRFAISSRLLIALFAFGPLAVALAPLGYLDADLLAGGYTAFFTRQMIWAGGLAPAMLAVLLVPALLRCKKIPPEARALASCLISSLALFIAGGVLGWMIQGQNVTIPAHYHGSVVGVTLAYMGVVYLLLPRFGYRAVAHTRLAFWQPIIYGAGQMMHITGLAWSGGYGVLRKTPGAMEGGFSSAKAAMGLMGAGGGLAIIGGLLFVIVVLRAARR